LSVSSEEFDPGLLILDVEGNILLANDNLDDTTTTAGFVGLQIPADMSLVLQVVSLDTEGGGSFQLVTADSAE
jgi:FtsP/CotA-like multicopper oxidase with cupredoxin domain